MLTIFFTKSILFLTISFFLALYTTPTSFANSSPCQGRQIPLASPSLPPCGINFIKGSPLLDSPLDKVYPGLSGRR